MKGFRARPHRRRARHLWPPLLALGWLNTLAGCGGSADSPESQRSPLQTVEQLMALRAAGSYDPMAGLIVPERAQDVAATLLAVDDYLNANRELCNFIRDEVALGLAASIDQSHVRANLDIFSPYVELLDETIDDDRATVSYWVDGKLPAKRAQLRRVGGAWRYDPGPGYSPELPAAFHRMARGLRQVVEEVRSGRLSRETLRDDPQRLLEEVRIRLLPGVRLLPPANAPARRPD